MVDTTSQFNRVLTPGERPPAPCTSTDTNHADNTSAPNTGHNEGSKTTNSEAETTTKDRKTDTEQPMDTTNTEPSSSKPKGLCFGQIILVSCVPQLSKSKKGS